MSMPPPRVGCAGWGLPADAKAAFGPAPSNLQRYATRLNATEINSSFYRPHQRATYERWAAGVPAGFSFSVKLPKAMSHERRLVGCEGLLEPFLEQATGLGSRLGCLLLQLPPSLPLDPRAADAFLRVLRQRYTGHVAAEPRHASWFTPEADAMLASWQVARVLADPVLHAAGERPGGWQPLAYLRLHGSPRTYWSSYDETLLTSLAKRIRLAQMQGVAVWCVFDNTASGAATHNALALQAELTKGPA